MVSFGSGVVAVLELQEMTRTESADKMKSFFMVRWVKAQSCVKL
jgi:hypothetical protein